MLRFWDLLKGWNFPPLMVGFVRAMLEVGVLAMLAFVGANLDQIAGWIPYLDSPERIAGFMIIGMPVLRTIEGWADQVIDPMQNRTAETRAANPPQ